MAITVESAVDATPISREPVRRAKCRKNISSQRICSKPEFCVRCLGIIHQVQIGWIFLQITSAKTQPSTMTSNIMHEATGIFFFPQAVSLFLFIIIIPRSLRTLGSIRSFMICPTMLQRSPLHLSAGTEPSAYCNRRNGRFRKTAFRCPDRKIPSLRYRCLPEYAEQRSPSD